MSNETLRACDLGSTIGLNSGDQTPVFAYLILAVFPASLIIAAANDVYEFKIPNWLNLILFTAYPIGGFVIGAPTPLVFEGLLIGAGFLALGFGLFAIKIIGGGDAKLFAATAPWIGLHALGNFLFYTALAGMVMAIVMGIFRKMPIMPVYAHAPWLMELHKRKRDLPYAVAIGAGGLLCFQQMPYFQFVFGG